MSKGKCMKNNLNGKSPFARSTEGYHCNNPSPGLGDFTSAPPEAGTGPD